MNSSMAFPVPSSLGSLDSYVQAVNRFPLLTAENEANLARKFRDEGDVEAARQLVLSQRSASSGKKTSRRLWRNPTSRPTASSNSTAIARSRNFQP